MPKLILKNIQGSGANSIDVLCDKASSSEFSSDTQALWQHILKHTAFSGREWLVQATQNLAGPEHEQNVEICVYSSEKKSVPVLVWSRQPPSGSVSDVEAQARAAAWRHLAGSGRDTIWVMTGLGACCRLWVLQRGKKQRLVPIWPPRSAAAPTRQEWRRRAPRRNGGRSRSTKRPLLTPPLGHRHFLEEETMHGAMSAEGIGRISHGRVDLRRARMLRVVRELPGPRNMASPDQTPTQELEGWNWTETHSRDGDAALDGYIDVRDGMGDYQEIFALVRDHPYPRISRRKLISM